MRSNSTTTTHTRAWNDLIAFYIFSLEEEKKLRWSYFPPQRRSICVGSVSAASLSATEIRTLKMFCGFADDCYHYLLLLAAILQSPVFSMGPIQNCSSAPTFNTQTGNWQRAAYSKTIFHDWNWLFLDVDKSLSLTRFANLINTIAICKSDIYGCTYDLHISKIDFFKNSK